MTRVWLVCVATLLGGCTLHSDQHHVDPPDGAVVDAAQPDATVALPDAAIMCSDVDGAVADGGDAGSPGSDAGDLAVQAIAVNQDGPERVASDGVHVFWSTLGNRLPPGRVLRADLDGSNPFPLAPGTTPCDLALDGSTVFISMCGTNTLVRVGKDGSGLTTLVLGVAAGAVATSTSGVFWVDRGTRLMNGTAVDDGAIIELRRAGTTLGAPDRLTSHERAPTGLVADGDTVYWTTEAGGAISSLGPSHAVTSVVTGLDHPTSLTMDAESLYWLEPTAGVLRTIGKHACTPRTLATGLLSPTAIAASAASIYIGNGDGRLLRLPKRGGAAVVLADGQLDFSSIAVDDRFVYWADVRRNTVMRAGK